MKGRWLEEERSATDGLWIEEERFILKHLVWEAWTSEERSAMKGRWIEVENLSLIHISEPTRLRCISYAVF